MRKSDLLKLLNDVPGNPEVVIWNGFVGDWQKISPDLVEIRLVKHSRQFLESAINFQRSQEQLPPLTEEELNARVKQEEWNTPNQFVKPEKMTDLYGTKRKRLLVLSGLKRGKTSCDRLGTMKY